MDIDMIVTAVFTAIIVAWLVYFPLKTKLQDLEQTNCRQATELYESRQASADLQVKNNELLEKNQNLSKTLVGMETKILNFEAKALGISGNTDIPDPELDSPDEIDAFTLTGIPTQSTFSDL